MVECLICKASFEDDKKLHAHLKAHNLRVFEYYQQVSPRRDLFDGSMIAFKNKKQYFNTDFNSVRNMRLWLDKQPAPKRELYLKNLISKRSDEKHLSYAPCQVELRSLKMPGINYYNQVFGSYYSLIEQLGLMTRYSFVERLEKRQLFNESDAKIFIDSREQLPLDFNCKSEVKGLKFGDYSFYDADKAGNTFIERKSLNDFIGTLSGGYERFEREIIRAKEANAYLIILVEEDLSRAIKFNIIDSVYKKGVRITPEFVFHNVRELTQKYDHIQFLFIKDRASAPKMVETIFCYGSELRKIDIQYYYDIGKL